MSAETAVGPARYDCEDCGFHIVDWSDDVGGFWEEVAAHEDAHREEEREQLERERHHFSSQAGLASFQPIPFPSSICLPGERIPPGMSAPLTDTPAVGGE